MEKQLPRYVAIDPGLSVGYAFFDHEGAATGHGNIKFEGLLSILRILYEGYSLKGRDLTIIYEDFALDERLAREVARNPHSRKMEASQCIGALKLFSTLVNCELVAQSREKNRLAMQWSGLDSNKNHANSHWKSAYNHGLYHLVTQVKILDRYNVPKPKEN